MSPHDKVLAAIFGPANEVEGEANRARQLLADQAQARALAQHAGVHLEWAGMEWLPALCNGNPMAVAIHEGTAYQAVPMSPEWGFATLSEVSVSLTEVLTD